MDQSGTIISREAYCEDAVEAFWDVFYAAFPEISGGDTELTSEDMGAMHEWLTGTSGPFATKELGLFDIPGVSDERFRAAIRDATRAACQVLRRLNPQIPEVPTRVRWRLESCANHQLHWNFQNQVTGEASDVAKSEEMIAAQLRAFMATVEEADSAFNALPEDLKEQLIDWAQAPRNVAGGGFNVSQLLSMAHDELASFLESVGLTVGKPGATR